MRTEQLTWETELLKWKYYSVVAFLYNVCIFISQEKWNSKIFMVGFDHPDKVGMPFAHITWINSASTYLWKGDSFIGLTILFFSRNVWGRVESRWLGSFKDILHVLAVSEKQIWQSLLHSFSLVLYKSFEFRSVYLI